MLPGIPPMRSAELAGSARTALVAPRAWTGKLSGFAAVKTVSYV